MNQVHCTAFEGTRRIASGRVEEVALATKAVLEGGSRASVLIFDDRTGEQIEFDLRGSTEEVLGRLASQGEPQAPETTEEAHRGPGRPKLGVVAREVTLLPRHWDWLKGQPGGASVALRKLVEDARKRNEGRDRKRHSQEAAYRFISAMAGNFPGFEEATRALFAGDASRFGPLVEDWPADVRDHAKQMAAAAFEAGAGVSAD